MEKLYRIGHHPNRPTLEDIYQRGALAEIRALPEMRLVEARDYYAALVTRGVWSVGGIYLHIPTRKVLGCVTSTT